MTNHNRLLTCFVFLLVLSFSSFSTAENQFKPSLTEVYKTAINDEKISDIELRVLTVYGDEFLGEAKNSNNSDLKKFYETYKILETNFSTNRKEVEWQNKKKLERAVNYFETRGLDFTLSKYLRHERISLRRRIAKSLQSIVTILSFENIISAYKETLEPKTRTGGLAVVESKLRKLYVSLLKKILKKHEVAYDQKRNNNEFVEFCEKWWEKEGKKRKKKYVRQLYKEIKSPKKKEEK